VGLGLSGFRPFFALLAGLNLGRSRWNWLPPRCPLGSPARLLSRVEDLDVVILLITRAFLGITGEFTAHVSPTQGWRSNVDGEELAVGEPNSGSCPRGLSGAGGVERTTWPLGEDVHCACGNQENRD
jgi:hypothetical protein